MQSWGEHSAFADRDTIAHPTRSGLIGMFASALGIRRADATADAADPTPEQKLFTRLTSLRFTVRHDRAGVRLSDFHTVGGGFPAHRTVPTAKGTRRGAGTTTIVSRRHYLADAVFTVAVTSPDDPELVELCAQAAAAPRWPLHLGRRSCPPGPQLLPGPGLADPVAELLRLPLARPKARESAEDDAAKTVDVRFTTDDRFPDTFPVTTSGRTQLTTVNDQPVRLHARERVYRSRPAHTTTVALPASLCHGYGVDYLKALRDHFQPTEDRSAP
ncbi:type I-E CRISPR-associated protein Cas5/CasD [Streptomyces bohaiensis]|uniref:Type I-E CRISPR-associated protein Cas5/CasD n=2 Tax=Streptomyces bohaiensis TaxID=1431344 RepID=A0ABX1C9X2_9ACTN|nr:type I-E CRISPR-associated protein Cas5/CasD [Streptomyces bohaiensis]